MTGTGSNASEVEGERALPNGAKAGWWVAKTLLAVFAGLLGTWPEPLWKQHPAGEESCGWESRPPSGNWGKDQEYSRCNSSTTGEGKGRPLLQALQGNVHLWGNSFLSLCSSILVQDESWRGECHIYEARSPSLLLDVQAAGIIAMPCQDPPLHSLRFLP